MSPGEETTTALGQEPEADLVESLYHRQLGKSTLMQNALAPYHFRSCSPQRVEELLEVQGHGLKHFGRPAAKFSYSSKEELGRVKEKERETETPVETVQKQR